MAAWRNRHRIVAFGSAAVAGLLVYTFVPEWLHGATRFVAAYDAGTITLLSFFWLKGLHDDPKMTRARAALDDPGKNAILLVVLGAVVVGLVAAIAILGHGPQVQNGTEKWAAYILGVVAISAGWFLVHTVYTFRYAHLYYYDDDSDGVACGGIKFPGTDEPSDWDFAYFAFCIGTSFAVSDPQVTETRVRRDVMSQSVISFAYNSVIVGMVINLFAGIFSASSGGGGK
ncbi:MAG: hypothetical protein JWM87_4034 [Candidatus Eremiobacteraeota bacterium]|nr:hypothetical protein [Candidatus Eremiobacteraeota bacterium]